MFGMEVCREHLGEIRRRIGYVFQDSDNQLFMPTVYDDLAFAPRNYGMSRPPPWIRITGDAKTVEELFNAFLPESISIRDTAVRKEKKMIPDK